MILGCPVGKGMARVSVSVPFAGPVNPIPELPDCVCCGFLEVVVLVELVELVGILVLTVEEESEGFRSGGIVPTEVKEVHNVVMVGIVNLCVRT